MCSVTVCSKTRREKGHEDKEEEEKTFFQDSPWNPMFDSHYLNGGGALVDIGLDVSTDDIASEARLPGVRYDWGFREHI